MPDVLVVGAGPVGSFAALLLARRGLEVTVIERRAARSVRPRAIGLHPPAVRMLRQAGVPLDGAAPITRGTARDRGRILAEMPFEEPVLSLPQHRLEDSLRQLLLGLSTVVLREGTVVQGVAVPREDAGPAARRSAPAWGARRHGALLSLDAQGEVIDAPIVIAADGVGSSLRTAAGIGWRPVGRQARYLMADIEDATGFGSEAALWFTSDGVVESFPMPNGRRRWVVRSRIATTAGELAELVARRTGVRIHVPPGAVSVFLAGQHLADEWVRGSLVLLGDAAHEISPIGGQGMNLGLLDAARLADPLHRRLEGNATALAGWEAAGRRSARRAILQARFNMAVGAPAPRAVQPLRRSGIRLLSLWRSRLTDTFTMQRL
jgi:2-polyprenyl-6-methoxyphenol hydroxylase-like FAD-dependent oxidoreductase